MMRAGANSLRPYHSASNSVFSLYFLRLCPRPKIHVGHNLGD